ncbi:hypothetical protein PMAN_a2699 [Pseudoalteromonas marina]|nr:hypothetical protein PMAN_a2699 [Pseudoalteromonas marina]
MGIKYRGAQDMYEPPLLGSAWGLGYLLNPRKQKTVTLL